MRGPAFVRYLTVLLPALLVFLAETVRHEWLHSQMPVVLGNVVTGATALGISLLVFVPLYRRLDRSHARVRRLEIEQAIADERERIARELHDVISQALFFLNVETAALERSLRESGVSAAALGRVREIAQAVQDTAGRVRDTIFDLRTAREPGQPYTAWLRAYAKRWSDIHNVPVLVEETGPPLALPVERELHVMAVVREALHNVAKHAAAQAVRITLASRDGGHAITIADNGRGLPEAPPGPRQGRYGLAMLREHAEAAGGTLQISRVAGGETEVVLTLPRAPAAP